MHFSKLVSESEEASMIYVTAVVCIFLFVYLTVALVRPEWF
jgi:K+-transporting ATPase KdpF subunit